MVFFRLLILLAGLGVVSAVLAWLMTGRRRYLIVAANIFKCALVLALVFFAVLIFERLE